MQLNKYAETFHRYSLITVSWQYGIHNNIANNQNNSDEKHDQQQHTLDLCNKNQIIIYYLMINNCDISHLHHFKSKQIIYKTQMQCQVFAFTAIFRRLCRFGRRQTTQTM